MGRTILNAEQMSRIEEAVHSGPGREAPPPLPSLQQLSSVCGWYGAGNLQAEILTNYP